MTDPTTPLTAESETWRKELDDIWWREDERAETLRRLRAIEAAAARRALEGSGVVSVEVVAPAINGMLSTGWLMDSLTEPVGWEGKPNPHQWLYDAIVAAGKAVDAALPRPEEPRVERCTVCGVGRWVIAHDPEAGSRYHPFTPEAR